MRNNILAKLFFFFIINSLFIAGLVLFFTSRSLDANNMSVFTSALKAEAKMAAYQARGLYTANDFAALDAWAKGSVDGTDLRISIITRAGAVVADSSDEPSAMENHLNREEVENLFQGKDTVITRHSQTLGKEMLYVAVPLFADNRAALRMSFPLEDISVLSSVYVKQNLAAAVLIFVIALFLSYIISHLFSSRIKKLANAFKSLAAGNFKVRTDIKSGDELQDLSDMFNEMAEQNEKNFAEITRAKRELDSIISSVSDGIIVVNPAGKILLANNAFNKNFAYAKYYWEVFGKSALDQGLSAREANVSATLEAQGKYFLCSMAPVQGSEQFVIVMHDITELKNLENVKKDLISNVSHELKTPLASFKAYLEFLDGTDDKEERVEYLRVLMKNTVRLTKIVEDLLILSSLEKGLPLDISEFELDELFNEMKILFKDKAALKGIGLTFGHTGFKIKADKFRMEQALSNLIENAIRYSEKGEIKISASQDEDDVQIAVADTGIGISPENQKRIFERFFVADKSRSKKTGGTGLGLSIVKHIAEQHGGRLSLTSTPGAGSVFTISLPK